MEFGGDVSVNSVSDHMSLFCMDYEDPFETGFPPLTDDCVSFEAFDAAISGIRTPDPFHVIPDEILRHIMKFLEPAALFFVADVSKRFREAACQEIRSFSIAVYPYKAEPGLKLLKKLDIADRLIVRLQNLRSLDLSHPACGTFLDSNTRISSFASSLATACRKIEKFSLVGVRGGRLLSVYVRSLGHDAKVTHVSLNIMQAAIGCANHLMRARKYLKLSKLSLRTSHRIRRCSRTTDVLSHLFRDLLPGVHALELHLPDTDEDIVSLAVRETSALIRFSAGSISGSGLLALAERCPDIQSLKIGARTDSLKQLHHFARLSRLWISVAGHADGDAEEVEWAFRTEPLCSQLRLLVVRGFLTSDPLLGIGRLSGLQTLILDHSNRFLYYDMSHNYRVMRNLKQIVVMNTFRVSILVPGPVAGTERSSADFHKLFPALTRIRFTDCEFQIHGKEFQCVPANSSAEKCELLFYL